MKQVKRITVMFLTALMCVLFHLPAARSDDSSILDLKLSGMSTEGIALSWNDLGADTYEVCRNDAVMQ